MTVQSGIEHKIQGALRPVFLQVANESHMHNVPAGSESHFKVTVVSAEFDGKLPLARHRVLNQLLKEELEGPVHALSLHTFTPEEWQERQGQTRNSPLCQGGSKAG